MLSDTDKSNFNETLWHFYDSHGRHTLPWRQSESDGHYDPYKILVSEIMLQQTQVTRVIPKYEEFLLQFPNVADLAGADQAEVVKIWSGLGYNRRARYLHQAAQAIIERTDKIFPSTTTELIKLSGVGNNTAGAIMAYAFNKPVVFVETNIRTVMIHHFFKNKDNIPDSEIIDITTMLVDRSNPREWYWALMDYGTHLKQTTGNNIHLSKQYVKQAVFNGSKRQIRGQVLRELADADVSERRLAEKITDPRLQEIIVDLVNEGLVTKKGSRLSL